MSNDFVPYTNLGAQSAQVKTQLLKAVENVIDSGHYILGPAVTEFEKQFAKFCATDYALGVANGTCSLHLIYKSLGIGVGDEVITAPNSFLASASTIALVGATPVFADICYDLNIDPQKLEEAITPKTKAILPVHLTGRPAKMDQICEIAKRHNLIVIEDAAQAVGAKYKGRVVGGIGDIGSFSLHPLKNLYAFGDAGVVTIKDGNFFETMKKARCHGLKNRTECDFWSYNCRLDEIQAALLLVQMTKLQEWTEERRRLAFIYNQELKGVVSVPEEGPGEYCVYQTYAIRAQKRDQLHDYMLAQGVDVKIHYPIPIHMQKAAADLGYGANDFPETMKACSEILSLPLYPGLTQNQQSKVISKIKEFYAGKV